MEKTFRHYIVGHFHIRAGRRYRIVKVFRPRISIKKEQEVRTVLTEFFMGKDFSEYHNILPKKWEEGVSYELQRIRYISNTHEPIKD